MKRVGCCVLLLQALAGSVSAEQVVVTDSVVVPGERVGPITASSDENDLLRWFGHEVVVPTDVYMGESSVIPSAPYDLGGRSSAAGTTVFPAGPNAVEILWRDPVGRQCPYAAVMRVAESRWTTVKGIRVGVSIEELERLNGGPFTFAGFEWDGSGMLYSWEGGRLEEDHRIGTEFFGVVAIRSTEGVPDEEMKRLSGSRALSSDDPIIRRLHLELAIMGVLWRPSKSDRTAVGPC